MLRRPAVHRCPRALRPSNQPSATSKPRTTKQTQPLRTAVKSVSYNAVPLPPPAAPPRSKGAACRPASVARASKRPAASPGPANHESRPLPPGLPPSPNPAPAPKRQNRTTKQTHLAEPHAKSAFYNAVSTPPLTCRTLFISNNRTTKQTHLAEPHRNQRFSQHPALTCRAPPGVPCRHSWRHSLPAQPHNLSTLHPPPVAKPVRQTDPIPKNRSRPTSYGHLPRTASRISPGPRQSKTTVARRSKRPAAFPGPPSD